MPYAVFRPTLNFPRILQSLPLILFVFFSSILATGCSSDTPDYFLDNFLKSGKETLILDVNQNLVINQENRTMTLKASLGRKDKQLVQIEEQNGIQKRIKFIQAGKYQITISSDEKNTAPNQFQQTINIQVR
ncbi:MAG: hypothetical protein OQK04_00250 [Kangiellaceae bacterium]|nr:hypothetical protein [Kangiellaceae bacterium]MCW8997130.1 hypothetical protein [Kangiellaceae bacterium]